jgi:hypothetical protein
VLSSSADQILFLELSLHIELIIATTSQSALQVVRLLDPSGHVSGVVIHAPKQKKKII